MRLTVGILAFNCVDLIGDQLASIQKGLSGVDDWSLVIADGGSTDGTVELARTLLPDATIVSLPGNPGFPALANAVAASDPASDVVMIMSRTSRLLPGAAAKLLAAFDDPSVGVAVPRLLMSDGRYDWSLRRAPSLARAWGEALLGRFALRLPTLTELVPDPAKYSARTRFEWATGGTTMFSRACHEAIGGWDETMFMYSEETDFELRAADHGFRVLFVPEAVAEHLGGASKIRAELWAHLCANRVRLYAKRHRRPAADLFWAAIVTGEALRLSSRRSTRLFAIRKLSRERRRLVRGEPASHPFRSETA